MKDNTLLAEYRGYKLKVREPAGPNLFENKDGEWFWEHEWHPNSDWNQLMMVVEKADCDFKIELNIGDHNVKYRYLAKLIFYGRSQGDNARMEMLYYGHGETRKKSLYNACVEYIKTQKP